MRRHASRASPCEQRHRRHQPHDAVRDRVAQGVDEGIVGHGAALRFENRAGGSDLNPYLALSALIAAGLHGVEQKLELEPAYEGNAYLATDKPRLPATLLEARDLFDGSTVARPSLADVLAQSAANGAKWSLRQIWTPADRAFVPEHRVESPYLVSVVDGRAVVHDRGVFVDDVQGGYWRLASGATVKGADGSVIARPTRADILAQAPGTGRSWRTEEFAAALRTAVPKAVAAVRERRPLDWTAVQESLEQWQERAGERPGVAVRSADLLVEALDDLAQALAGGARQQPALQNPTRGGDPSH